MKEATKARMIAAGVIPDPNLPPDQPKQTGAFNGPRGGRPRIHKPKPLKRKGLVGRPAGRLPGQFSPIEKDPKKDEIDRALLYNTIPRQKMVELYGYNQNQLMKRKLALRKRAQMASPEGRDPVARREQTQAARGIKKTIELMAWPLKASMAGNEAAMESKDLGAANAFINTYLETVQKYGQLTGELAPPGQTLVNQDNRMLTITALPRASDPQSVIDASEALVRLPASRGD